MAYGANSQWALIFTFKNLTNGQYPTLRRFHIINSQHKNTVLGPKCSLSYIANNTFQPPKRDNLQRGTTSKERQPPKRDNLQRETTSKEGQPPKRDNLQRETTSKEGQPPKRDNLSIKDKMADPKASYKLV